MPQPLDHPDDDEVEIMPDEDRCMECMECFTEDDEQVLFDGDYYHKACLASVIDEDDTEE